MPFAYANMRRQWDTEIMMTDASMGGFGVMAARVNQDEVDSMDHYDERWRFKAEYHQAEGPRAAALRAADPLRDMTTVLPVGTASRWIWGEAQTSPKVPDEALRPERWHEVAAYPWKHQGLIHTLEATACNVAL